MKVAIVGAGYSGLAAAWNLCQKTEHQVTVFDPNGIGGQASGLAAGLLHPFVGLHGKLNRFGREGIAATRNLLNVASSALGQPVFEESGILRLALNDEQRSDFAKSADLNDDVVWWPKEKVKDFYPHVTDAPGIFIQSGIAVHSAQYLKGLWKACESKSASFVNEPFFHFKEFDKIVIAAGQATKEFVDLPLNEIKGQILEFEWPETLPTLPCPIISKAYIVMTPDHKRCIVGSTFEKNFSSAEPDKEVALAEILPKAEAVLPALRDMKLLDCRAAVRVSMPGHLPVAKQVNDKVWVLCGMGSKGLLYHALYAGMLLEEMS